MTFEWPILLWGLLLVPLALAAYLLAQRRRARYAVRFTNLDLLANVAQRTPGWRRHLPMALYLTAFAALLVSLARPQALVRVPREQATVMLVMDVSGSMEATDVQPNRLSAAKSAAQSFLDQVPSAFQVGLVSFASEARTIAPPTTDRVAVRRAIDSLRSAGGTAMGDGLEHALATGQAVESAANPSPVPTARARPSASPAAAPAAPVAAAPAEEAAPLAVVLLSDGANTTGRVDPTTAAQHARALGVPVFTISLGTDQGTVRVAGSRGESRALRVPPDERTLQQIADATGGRFFEAPTASDLQAIYQDLGSRLGWVEEHQEVTVLFAGAALAMLALGSTLALHWFNRFP
jgi:Ca-activated chloride channel family protein